MQLLAVKNKKYSEPWDGVGHSFAWVTGLEGVRRVIIKFLRNDKSF